MWSDFRGKEKKETPKTEQVILKKETDKNLNKWINKRKLNWNEIKKSDNENDNIIRNIKKTII